jgi:hypothetical protein
MTKRGEVSHFFVLHKGSLGTVEFTFVKSTYVGSSAVLGREVRKNTPCHPFSKIEERIKMYFFSC